MNIVLLFIILSVINVIFSTIRSITTIKSGKTIASLVSGGYFAFYNIMLIYTVMDFPMWEKCIITFICNVVGVFTVKLVEEKLQKDKMWKVEVTIPTRNTSTLDFELEKSLTATLRLAKNILCLISTVPRRKKLKRLLKFVSSMTQNFSQVNVKSYSNTCTSRYFARAPKNFFKKSIDKYLFSCYNNYRN